MLASRAPRRPVRPPYGRSRARSREPPSLRDAAHVAVRRLAAGSPRVACAASSATAAGIGSLRAHACAPSFACCCAPPGARPEAAAGARAAALDGASIAASRRRHARLGDLRPSPPVAALPSSLAPARLQRALDAVRRAGAPARASPARSRRSRRSASSSGVGSHSATLGQVLERLEAEELEEQRRRAVQDRAELRAAGLLDQAALQQRRGAESAQTPRMRVISGRETGCR